MIEIRRFKTYWGKTFQFASIILAEKVFAAGGGTGNSIDFGSGVTNILTVINNFAGFFIGLSGIIAVVIVIYAGYLYMFSGGDPGKVSTARTTLLYLAIGYGLVLLTWAGLIPLIKEIGGFK